MNNKYFLNIPLDATKLDTVLTVKNKKENKARFTTGNTHINEVKKSDPKTALNQDKKGLFAFLVIFLFRCRIELVGYKDNSIANSTILFGPLFRFEVTFNCEQCALGKIFK